MARSIKPETESQPWDTLEFGTNILSHGEKRISSTKLHRDSDHVEHAGEKETFWDALRADTDAEAASSNPGDLKAYANVTTEERRWSVSGLDIPRINSQALAAAQSEHSMTFREGLKNYPKAMLWAALISLAIVGEGFDTSLINSLYAFDTFQHAYGRPAPNGTYQISPKWQAILNNCGVVGSIVGLLANGIISEYFGYRKTLLFATIALALFIFPSFFAFNIQTLLAGQILCAIPWGMCSTLVISYAAEIMPLALRGYLVANINMCWIIGQIIGLGTLRGFLHDKSHWSYRIPFSIQWIWCAIVIATILLGAPESPWWLVRKGRFEEAKMVIKRLAKKSPGFNPDNTVAMMRHTDEVEKRLNNGKAERNDLSYLECFRGKNLRRTEIACMIFMIQNMCGLPLIAFAAYTYRQIGFSDTLSFNMTVGMHGLALFACLLALLLIRRFGRRQIYLFGLGTAFMILLLASILACLPETKATLWGQAAMVITFIFIFDLTLGPLTYTIVAEMPSTRLRVNTVVLARISYNLNAVVTNLIVTHALNPLGWNLKGRTNWIWCGTCFLSFIYCYFRLPEAKGLTYHELDILFEKGADARKFAGIQKKLEESGYFGFYEHERSPSDATWR